MITPDENVKIKIFPHYKKSLLVKATVTINTPVFGFVTIKGFIVWESRNKNERLGDKINITPPSLQAFGRYFPLVFFEDREKWFELEELIYTKFKEVAAGNITVNPEEVPL